MSDREHFIATLQACYFGDKNAFDEIVRIYDKKENIIKEVREYIMSELITDWDIKNDGYVSGSDLPVDAITPILEILDKVNK